VRFFEETEDGISWEAFGDFASHDVHRQVRAVDVHNADRYHLITCTEDRLVPSDNNLYRVTYTEYRQVPSDEVQLCI